MLKGGEVLCVREGRYCVEGKGGIVCKGGEVLCVREGRYCV